MKFAFLQGFSLEKAIQQLVYRASRLFCLGIAKVVFRMRVEGREFVPQVGPAILAANHVSFIDPIIVGVAVSRLVHYMAKEELFRFRPFAWLLRQYQVFPVKRRRADLRAMNRAILLLEQGEIVVIFPEGTRGDGATLGPVRPGVILLAARVGVPVVPVFHAGMERVLPRGAWWPRRHPLTVRFGAPLRPPAAVLTSAVAAGTFGRQLVTQWALLRSAGGRDDGQRSRRGRHAPGRTHERRVDLYDR